MVRKILGLAASSDYDFRTFACPDDPLKHLFPEWVPYYRLKWAISRILQPKRILEVGVRYGYSAHAFLGGSPGAEYLGIDNNSDTFGGSRGAIEWARQLENEHSAKFLIADSQQMACFPGEGYDLIHIDGQRDGEGSTRDLRKALTQGRHILVDGFFWTYDNFLHVSQFVYQYRDFIEHYIVIPGYAGELLIQPKLDPMMSARVTNSGDLKESYTKSYYLLDCGGFDAYKRDKGIGLSDGRLQSVAHLADLAPPGEALDLGCGRGEVSLHLARSGRSVLAVDYSESAISLAKEAAASLDEAGSAIRFFCGDVNDAPLAVSYSVAVASDLIEHMMPEELEKLYSQVSRHLSREGLLVLHTFPNLWYYKYEYARRLRKAKEVGAYLPLQPRTRYEELMHINEQSPQVLRRQLQSHFPCVLLWFSGHDLSNPFDNLKRPFSRSEMRSAGDLFALASHSPIDLEVLVRSLEMLPVNVPIDLSLSLVAAPDRVSTDTVFKVQVRLENRSEHTLKSRPPNPVNLAYHWLSDTREIVVFDGRRTPVRVSAPGSIQNYTVGVDAPSGQGRFILRVTLVQEWIRWLDESPQNLWVETHIEVTGK